MEKAKGVVYAVCLLVMTMDIIAAVLGIQAEIAQNKVNNLRVWIFECRDPSYEAFKLGLVAAILLAFAHVIANMLGGCICIWSKEELDRSSQNKQLAAAALILSWITLIIAFSMLISGALSNSRPRQSCGISNHRLLSIGGILCFFHGLFTVAYYIASAAITEEQKKLHPPAGAVQA